MTNPQLLISTLSLLLISHLPTFLTQQPYTGQAITQCDSTDNTTSLLGYTCNGATRTCQSYATFRSHPPYTSVSAISALLSVNPSQLALLNSASLNTTFATDQPVLVPITCSCTHQHYQHNATYVVRDGDTYLAIANSTFQGLSTCQALQAQNAIPATGLLPGQRLNVPVRCACPTRNQTEVDNVNYLLSYLIGSNQFVTTISALFHVDPFVTYAANGLTETDTVYPFTTLLIPLRDPPTSTQLNAPQPPPPPPVAHPPPVPPLSGGTGSSRTWIYAVVGGVVGAAILVIAAAVSCFCFRKKKHQRKDEAVVTTSQSFESVEKPLANDDEDSQDFLSSLSSIAQSLKVYSFDELRKATEDFSSNCLIKGSVYRGTINGDPAAIKKMNGDVSKEINLLNKINHFNLIRLSGVCFKDGSWYLVYEYASNGPLSDWIFDRSEEKVIMDWNTRLQIAVDVAAGLNYLHSYASPPHVHKDLNSNNVLLDRDFRAKIANFGLARSAEGEEGEFALTRHIVGTKGYMAPEYLENGIISPKLDVYAFGVLLLEMLTGREVFVLYEELNMQSSEVLSSVLSENGRENLRNLMDPSLQGKYPHDLVVVLFGLIDSCLKKDPSDRPNMDDVFQTLSRISNSVVSGEWSISIDQTRPR